MAFEVLSPNPFLYDHLPQYRLVTDIYKTVNSYYTETDARRASRALLQKTEQLIREHVAVYDVSSPLPLYPINRHIADVIEQDQSSERVKVINLQRSIEKHVDENIEPAPYLASIGEEVEKIVERLRERQISVQTALEELQTAAERAATADEERQRSSLDDLAFALRTGLRAAPALATMDGDAADTLAQDIAAYLHENAGWPHNDRLQSTVRMELYKRLLAPMPKPANPREARAIVDDLLRMHRITL